MNISVLASVNLAHTFFNRNYNARSLCDVRAKRYKIIVEQKRFPK